MIFREGHQLQNILIKTCRPRDEEYGGEHVHMSSPRKRARVSFSEPTVHRYEVPGGKDENSENHQHTTHRTWLTRQELGYFRSCAKKLCRSVVLDDILHDAFDGAISRQEENESVAQEATSALMTSEDYVAQRGLERWSSNQHSLSRSMKIIEVKTGVLLEQTKQILSGKADASRLAQISCAASKPSQQFAQLLASVDADLAMCVRLEAC